MRLTFVISHFGCGGAQRVMSVLANAWAANGWEITLLTLDNGEERPFYDLHPAVMYLPLKVSRPSPTATHAIFNNLKRVWVLREAIKQSSPHVVISFLNMPNVLTILGTRGLSLFRNARIRSIVMSARHGHACDDWYIHIPHVWLSKPRLPCRSSRPRCNTVRT
jgi:hypothetical protein